MRPRVLGGVMAACFTAASCSTAELPVQPNSQGTVTPATVGISLEGPAVLHATESWNYRAWALRADGSRWPINDREVVYTSLNPSVATIDAVGSVLTWAPGQARFRAQHMAMTAEAALTVLPYAPPAGSVTLTGQVYLVPPSQDVPIAGVLADIRRAPGQPDLVLRTDNAGRFSVVLPPGSYFVRLTHDEYFFTTKTIDLRADTEVDFQMRPHTGYLTELFTRERGPVPFTQASVQYPIHLGGAMNFRVIRACISGTCSPPAPADVCFEARDADEKLVAQRRVAVGDTAQSPNTQIAGGSMHTIKVYTCGPGSFNAANAAFDEFSVAIYRPK